MKDFEKSERLCGNGIAERYNRDYHQSAIMKAHDEDFACFVAEWYHSGDRVLDLGCGPASLWPLWKRHLRESGALIGVDISEGMINECKRLFADDDFRVGSVFEIPAESGSIDLIIASSVLHHIPEKDLPEALQEMDRVLDEHGKVVGREPVSKGRLGDESGWLSGALMCFRHLVYRLTHTREYPEPELGKHHHAYIPDDFIRTLGKHFAPKSLRFKFPVSSYVLRCDHSLVGRVVSCLDNAIGHRGGHEFFYCAAKNYYDASDVAHCVEQELRLNSQPLKNMKEFLALLQRAAELLEREIGDSQRE